jgi:hypothetical protein
MPDTNITGPLWGYEQRSRRLGGLWPTVATPIPPIVGQQAYTTAGTYSWTAPAGVTSVSVVAIGGGGCGGHYFGGGGGGGGLAYKNSISVTPGTSYTVVVGAAGISYGPGWSPGENGTPAGNSSFTATFGTMTAGGGRNGRNTDYNTFIATGGAPSGTYDGGGTGGRGGAGLSNATPPGGDFWANGGGGAAGYSGNGGRGFGALNDASYVAKVDATAGSGGGGGGGGGSSAKNLNTDLAGGSGGGTGILGAASNGSAGSNASSYTSPGVSGGGGSGGATGSSATSVSSPGGGGLYGGGGGGNAGSGSSPGEGTNGLPALGSNGAVRIIWGTGRSFPSTLTTDQ